ncbi:MAG: Gfo/Idh/MocA family oxidoreductase [Rhodobacteraceae bacterium]|nr:MAG: Gfo/Idh/MocA family oxidoreductase [Paracoccaceae bacterium]
MKKVRYAVVGAGWISQEAFLPSIHAAANSEVTAIVSGSADVARKLADFHDIPNVYGYDDYDRMLADDVVDAVYIALPNSLHAEYTIRAAKAGKHALVEKPLAVSVEECQEMIRAAEDAGTLLMTAYRLHSEPGTVKVLDMIRSGAIGQPKFFVSTFSFQTARGNHRLLAEHWGGPLQDIGVYCLNAARHCLAAEPSEVSAMKVHGDGDPRFTEVEGSMAVTMRFPGDRLGQFLISFESDDTDTYRVIGTTGEITVEQAYDFHFNPRIWLTNGRERHEIEVPDTDHFAGQAAYFSDCILTGTRPVPDGEEGLADVRALLAIEAAAKSGRTQSVSTPERDRHPDQDCVRVLPRTERRLVL